MKQYENVRQYMFSIGYDDGMIDKIINSYSLIRMKEDTLFLNIQNVIRELTGELYGYTKEDVVKMTKSFPTLYSLDANYIRKRTLEIMKLGYTHDEVLKMIKLYPTIYSFGIESMKKKIEDMVELGYSRDEVIKMTKSLPSIFGKSMNNVKKKIEDMMVLGYTKEDVLKISKSIPSIYSQNIESINQKLLDFMQMGYSKKDVIKITRKVPSIFSVGASHLKNKMLEIMKLGYSYDEVIQLTNKFPIIYSLSIDTILKRISFYQSIGVTDFILNDSYKLMQSTKLSFARYMFYKEHDVSVENNDYRKLFISAKNFFKKYGITNVDLIKKYNYDLYLEERNNGLSI